MSSTLDIQKNMCTLLPKPKENDFVKKWWLVNTDSILSQVNKCTKI